jgi:hypothetical protein
MTINHQIKNSPDNLLPVYLFCPDCSPQDEDENNIYFESKNFFEKKLTDICNAKVLPPIFLEQRDAIGYCRSMGDNHGILKVYISEQAIQGIDQQTLVMNTNYLSKELIHSCHFVWRKNNNYLLNPNFKL